MRSPDRPAVSDPVDALMRVLDAARAYSKFVIFKPDRPAAAAREDLQRAIADYDRAFPGP